MEKLPELEDFKPIVLEEERMQDLLKEKDFMYELAYSGQFGFQVLMMHPEGHVQMVQDLMNLVEFWLECQNHTEGGVN